MGTRVDTFDRLLELLLQKGALSSGRAAVVLVAFGTAWFTYYPTRRAELTLPFPPRARADEVLPALVARAKGIQHVHAEPEPDAKIQDFQDRAMNVVFAAWFNTEHHGSVLSALARAGREVIDEARSRQALTPKSGRGDAVLE